MYAIRSYYDIQVNSLPALHYFNLYLQGNNREKARFLLRWKGVILQNSIENSYNRVKAFNYLDKADNLSGFEKNVAMYLHLKMKRSHRLTAVFETGNIALVAERTVLDFPKEHHSGLIYTEIERNNFV